MYSEKSRAADASHDVLREQEYKDASDPDATVPAEERAKAYKYGKQYVPVQAEDEAYLAYRPDRGISLMGFLDAESVPQQYHMKDPWVMVAEKGNERSGLAMSALVRAMANKNQDLRVAKFASLDEKPDLMPSLSQLDQMRAVVQELDLSTDVLINDTFDPRTATVRKAQTLLQTLPQHLHVEKKELVLERVQPKEEMPAEVTAFSLEGTAASSVETVGTSDPEL
ncbi:hypothetical protein COCSUDRAFT_83513 [Coccomyxa subellipsoidea C-169]|uniref:Ku domain-containing protein n=1 Tax=Coccomyxa subellipsoidea (strain C-169) TaxID=574566 RepID=I0YTK5_COCSC|nr:hypothetical protein COCSUDRAFT_83513 [Coccomyxa subellipsoidea C-169]EIE21724.1 hypothetical protein COCSUDRAFT_83513 [Coccomyxa subellipsoidea C-169]|eukprot:XP_005646268.1 hypothetical protein COCSUDRAFT_83513 [Coccomyxa subellipsoidea C-169]